MSETLVSEVLQETTRLNDNCRRSQTLKESRECNALNPTLCPMTFAKTSLFLEDKNFRISSICKPTKLTLPVFSSNKAQLGLRLSLGNRTAAW